MARSTRQTPRIAEKGLPGEKVRLRLELRLLAQVGLVGLPNAGKSSLLRAVSAARPKVGAYGFTTLEPFLGVADVGYERLLVADIPGLVERSYMGAGLGNRFLRHVERTGVLVIVVDASQPDLLKDMANVRGELKAFGQGVGEKPWLVAFNKIDLPVARDNARAAIAKLQRRGGAGYAVSALTGEGTAELIQAAYTLAHETKADRAAPGRRAEPAIRPVAAVFQVHKRNGAYEVSGRRPAEIVAQLGLESEEARLEVSRRLRRIGVLGALRRAGVSAGDQVRIGAAELEWPL